MRIAQIEDNPVVAEGVMLRFEVRWPDACVSHAQLGEHGMKMIGPENPVIVILGLEVSDMDGFDVCAQIRSSSAIFIVVLTVRDTLEEIMKGSELGADDYMASPFKPVEFLARVSYGTLLRCVHVAHVQRLGLAFQQDDVAIDFARSRVCEDRESVNLGPVE